MSPCTTKAPLRPDRGMHRMRSAKLPYFSAVSEAYLCPVSSSLEGSRKNEDLGQRTVLFAATMLIISSSPRKKFAC